MSLYFSGAAAQRFEQIVPKALDRRNADLLVGRVRITDRRAERDHVQMRIVRTDDAALEPGVNGRHDRPATEKAFVRRDHRRQNRGIHVGIPAVVSPAQDDFGPGRARIPRRCARPNRASRCRPSCATGTVPRSGRRTRRRGPGSWTSARAPSSTGSFARRRSDIRARHGSAVAAYPYRSAKRAGPVSSAVTLTPFVDVRSSSRTVRSKSRTALAERPGFGSRHRHDGPGPRAGSHCAARLRRRSTGAGRMPSRPF